MPRTGGIGGALAAGLAMLLAGSSIAVAEDLVHYPVLGGQAIRYAVAALALLAIGRHRRWLRLPSRRDTLLLAGLAAAGLAGFNICVLLAVKDGAAPAAVGVVVGCVPIVLALLGPLIQGKKPSTRLLLAAMLAALGAATVQGLSGSTTPMGVALSVGAMAGEAGFSLLAAPVISRLGPVNTAAYACLSAALILGAGAAVADGSRAFRQPTLVEAGAIFYLALAVTVVAFVCWYTSIERVGVARTGIFAGLVPVGACLAAIAIGTGSFNAAQAVGTCVVAGSIALALLPAFTTRSSPARQPLCAPAEVPAW